MSSTLKRKKYKNLLDNKNAENASTTFIYNPNCEKYVILSEEEKNLVVYSRLLRKLLYETNNYLLENFNNQLDSYSYTRYADEIKLKKTALSNDLGSEYIPAELFDANAGIKHSTKNNNKKLYVALHSEEYEKYEIDENIDVSSEEYGNEDYAHNYYMDENKDDEFVDVDKEDNYSE